MLQRSLHQRKSIWLGLFVLLFLGWAWFSSIQRAYMVRIGSPLAPGCLVLWQSDGTLGMARYKESSEWTLVCNELLFGAVTGPVSLWQDRHGNPRFSMPAALMGGLSEEGVGVGIAHWLLMLFHVAGLSTWIRWRIRRERGF